MALSLAACGGGKTTAGTATKAAADTTAAGTENAAAEGKEDAGTELTGRLKAIKEAGVLKVATSPIIRRMSLKISQKTARINM